MTKSLVCVDLKALVSAITVLNIVFTDLHNHLQEMLVSLQKTEVKLSERLAALESRVNARVQRMTDESLQASNAWLTPFVVLVRHPVDSTSFAVGVNDDVMYMLSLLLRRW